MDPSSVHRTESKNPVGGFRDPKPELSLNCLPSGIKNRDGFPGNSRKNRNRAAGAARLSRPVMAFYYRQFIPPPRKVNAR